MEGAVDGISYRYSEGIGKPIIFLHGWLGSERSWDQVISRLDLDNPMLRYDQRCHGRSDCTPFDLERLATDLRRLINHLDLDEPILAGHSLGGMVALQYTASYGTPAAAFLAGTCASTPDPASGTPRSFLDQLGERDRQDWAAAIASNYCPDNSEMREQARKELEEAGIEVLRHGLEAIDAYDVTVNIDNSLQALVVAASRDQAVTYEKTQELADLIDAPHVTIDSSHLMLQERPEQVAGLLQEFVDEIGSGGT
ncbi:MAG: alpha/beta hydrolase, partial [Candidatus Nanohaloarchaea archaeon]|nr:alpha/beta hydrolase [Candidatus Nanohaloarchaea archaeon]